MGLPPGGKACFKALMIEKQESHIERRSHEFLDGLIEVADYQGHATGMKLGVEDSREMR